MWRQFRQRVPVRLILASALLLFAASGCATAASTSPIDDASSSPVAETAAVRGLLRDNAVVKKSIVNPSVTIGGVHATIDRWLGDGS